MFRFRHIKFALTGCTDWTDASTLSFAIPVYYEKDVSLVNFNLQGQYRTKTEVRYERLYGRYLVSNKKIIINKCMVGAAAVLSTYRFLNTFSCTHELNRKT